MAFVGFRMALKLWFPLSLFAFVPPMGEELIPYLQMITANLSVFLLKLTGIPIHHNSLYISIPAGDFVVAEACSGIRFFVVCVFVGYMFACINFLNNYKRAAFLLFALVLPIVANGIRVFGIIIVGHLSDMKYAVGADHLVYGWVFFVIVLLILLLVGHKFSEPVPRFDVPSLGEYVPQWQQTKWWRPFLLMLLPLVIAGWGRYVVAEGNIENQIQVSMDQWSGVASERKQMGWSPQLSNTSGEISKSLFDEGILYDVYVGWYNDNQPEAELIMWSNRLYDKDRWALDSSFTLVFSEGGHQAELLAVTSLSGKKRVIIYWYQVEGFRGFNKLKVKLQQALNRLTGRFAGGALIAISYEVRNKSLEEIKKSAQSSEFFTRISNSVVIE